MGNIDNIAQISCVEDISRFFPGADTAHYIKKRGGREWHGPCPFCGGVDRFHFYIYQGDWFARCNIGTHFYTKSGAPLKAIALHNLGGRAPTAEEKRKLKMKQEQEEDKEIRERYGLFRMLTDERIEGLPIWDLLHRNLMYSQKHIDSLLADGLALETLKAFHIGYNPEFRIYDWNTKQHSNYECFTFPTFRYIYDPSRGMDGVFCTNIRHRLIGFTGTGKYRPFMAGLSLDYFECRRPNRVLIITEGEKKAMAFWQLGYHAIGLWGVESFFKEWVREIQAIRKPIYVIFDHEEDPVKQQNMVRLSEALAERLKGTSIVLPMVGKPDDLIRDGLLTPEVIGGFLVPQNIIDIR